MRDNRRFWYVPATIVSPGCEGDVADAKFYRCPLADMNRGGPVWHSIETHRRVSVSGVSLSDVTKKATAAVLDAIATVDHSIETLRNKRQERELERIRQSRG